MSSIDGDDDSDFDLQELMFRISSTGNVADEYNDGNEQVGNWTIVSRDYKTSIKVDSVDKHLLDLAHNEIPIVLAGLKAKMFGGQHQYLNNVLAAKYLQAWMETC